jgi:hypothetical protein
VKVDVVQASDARAIETAFAILVGNKVEGLVVAADPFLLVVACNLPRLRRAI